MTNQEFIYTTYIKTTAEKLWVAITNPEFARQYWEHENVSDWKDGSKWQHVSSTDRSIKLTGKVVKSIPPSRLTLTWADPKDPTEVSQVTFEIDTIEEMVRLTVIHGGFKAGSKMLEKIASGWPRVLSSMKSFLETGKALNTWAGHNH